ncbi:MAG: hypothetical protein II337_07795 [Clostridia bacterium]|nr:hypothetical protein [Clostridia bacterium]
MKKTLITVTLALALLFVFAALPLSAQTTEYQIGASEGGLLTDGRIADAFRSAADRFSEWMYEGVPSGYVTQRDGYYWQPYSDPDNNGAAIFVGSDYTPYVMRGPIYEGLESLGGLGTLGHPQSDAYQVNGTWYQNFKNGYATVGDDGRVSFVRGSRVGTDGTATDLPASDSSATTDSMTDTVTDATTNLTDSSTDKVSSPSQMISDVVSDVEETAPMWGTWLFVIILVLAVVLLAVYWFMKRR